MHHSSTQSHVPRASRPRVATRLRLLLPVAALTLALLPFGPAAAATAAPLRATFTLDTVPTTISSSWLPSPAFTVAAAIDPNQVAYSLAGHGSVSELDVMSIRYGRSSPLMGFPPAAAGAAADYLAAFRQLRRKSGAVVGRAPAVSLFGQRASGIVSTEDARGIRPATTIVEWVGEARSRVWIVRATEELRPGVSPSGFAAQVGGGLTLTSAPTAPRRSSIVGPSNLGVGDSVTSAWFSGSRTVTQGYGCTTFTAEPVDNRFNCGGIASDGLNHVHEGIDFGYPSDCYSVNYGVFAGSSGTVDILQDPNGYGANYPVVRLDTGQFAVLGHVRAILVAAGTHVSPGTLIAYIGSEGLSTGCHLHFEVDLTEGVTRTSVDPTAWLGGRSGTADLIARRPSDEALCLYAGNGTGGFLTGDCQVIGNGWGGFDKIIAAGDWNGDGHPDLIARTTDGTLCLYAGNGTGGFVTGSCQVIGNGWSGFQTIVGGVDWNGDGHPDLVAQAYDGTLCLYAGNGSGGFITGSCQVIGNGWDIFNYIVSPGDWNGDGHPDLIAEKPDGTLCLYAGNGSGGFVTGSCQVIGSGWDMFDWVVAPGDWNGDGHPDLIAKKSDGTLYLYAGDGSGGFLYPYPQIGNGWNSFNTVLGPGNWDGQ